MPEINEVRHYADFIKSKMKNKKIITKHLGSLQKNRIQIILGPLCLHQLKINKSESSEVGSGLL